VGRDLRDTAEWGGWSVGLVRECLSVIASAAGEDLEELIAGARENARLDVISATSEAERVEQRLSNMRRERLLPDDRTLEKVSRYEAHLSRLMFRALH
jgi:vacuolar-type H+-ATPase subunit H